VDKNGGYNEAGFRIAGSSPVGSVYAIHRDHFETHDTDPKPSHGVPRMFRYNR